MDAIKTLVHFFHENPRCHEELEKFRRGRAEAARANAAPSPDGNDGASLTDRSG
jgi:hypothetical protein